MHRVLALRKGLSSQTVSTIKGKVEVEVVYLTLFYEILIWYSSGLYTAIDHTILVSECDQFTREDYTNEKVKGKS